MIEINIYLVLLINIVVSIIAALGTSYLKEVGKNLAISQLKGKLTEIDENIKKQIEQKGKINETQNKMLIDFHADCDNLIFETMKLHDDLYHHIYVKEQIPDIKKMVTKLNTSISALSLFFNDSLILEKAKNLAGSLISLSTYRIDSIIMYNFFVSEIDEKQNSLGSFNINVIDKESESSKEYRENLMSDIKKASERRNEIYYESPKKLKEHLDDVNKRKIEFQDIVRKQILKN